MTAGRSVLITGAASGIGLAIAHEFAGRGHQVLLTDVNASVKDTARSLSADGSPFQAYVADLADEQAVLSLAAHAQELFSGCDILINSAGVSPKSKGEATQPTDIATPDWERVLRINLTAPFILCRELIASMQAKQFGRIINIASRAGRTYVAPTGVHYAASKAGLLGMTRQFAGIYARYGITANCIAPGRIETPLASLSSAAIIEHAKASIPAQRLGRPDEIACVAYFLASAGASYVNGACIDANGGAFMA